MKWPGAVETLDDENLASAELGDFARWRFESEGSDEFVEVEEGARA